MTTTYAAIIPDHATTLYPTFGVDIIERHPEGDWQHVLWIEGGEYPETAAGIKQRADELAEGACWRIDWTPGNGRFESWGLEYVDYPASRTGSDGALYTYTDKYGETLTGGLYAIGAELIWGSGDYRGYGAGRLTDNPEPWANVDDERDTSVPFTVEQWVRWAATVEDRPVQHVAAALVKAEVMP